jgi:hypothetical protein
MHAATSLSPAGNLSGLQELGVAARARGHRRRKPRGSRERRYRGRCQAQSGDGVGGTGTKLPPSADVYFAVESFAAYGRLGRRNLEDMEAGARVEVDTRKRNPMDFALWKGETPGDGVVWWESPWGPGRPGWHIECSAMSGKYLGESFDVHCGGKDLIFPHHENEIAQSEAASGKQLSRYWLHNGFVNIDNEKMSKSLGNFFTIREVREKFDPQTIRLRSNDSRSCSPSSASIGPAVSLASPGWTRWAWAPSPGRWSPPR